MNGDILLRSRSIELDSGLSFIGNATGNHRKGIGLGCCDGDTGNLGPHIHSVVGLSSGKAWR